MATTCKLIGKVTLGSAAATIEFTNIPGTYTDLSLGMSLRSADSVRQSSILLSLNGSTSSFSSRSLRGSGSAASSFQYGTARALGQINGDTSTSNTFASVEVYIPNYAGSTNKSYSVTAAQEDNQTEAYIEAEAGLWSNTAAITSVAVTVTGGGNFKSGSSAFLYGITKS